MKITMIAAAAMMVLAGAQAAPAQEAAHGGLQSECRADFTKYCAGIPAGGASRVQCLNDHRVDLSDGCKAALTGLKTARQACALDAAKYCAEAPPGAERMKCMTANRNNLSDGCKSALTAAAVSAD